MTTTLADFLLARITEAEHLARLAQEAGANTAPFNLAPAGAFAAARVLAECEAKRQIVAVCVEDLEARGDGALDGKVDRATWDVLAVLASVYADHPDYREEWKP